MEISNLREAMIKQFKKFPYYFQLSFILCFCVLLIKFPSHGYFAEFYAEAGTNFFYNSYENTFLKALRIPEAGYLPLVQRISSEILVYFGRFYPSIFPNLYGIFSIFIISLLTALINLNDFKVLIKDNFIRFILSLTLLTFPDFEIFAFINFPYFGYLFIFLAIIKRYKTYLEQFVWGFISLIFVCSKALLISVLPVVGLYFIFDFGFKRKKKFLVYFLILLGGLFQIGYSVLNLTSNNEHKEFSNIFTVCIDSLFYSLSSIVFGLFPGLKEIDLLSLFVLFCFFIYFCRKYKLTKIQYSSIFFLVISSLSSIFILFVLNPKVTYLGSYQFLSQDMFNGMLFFRWTFISIMSGYIIAFVLIDKWSWNFVKFALVLIVLIPKLIVFNNLYDIQLIDQSYKVNWKNEYKKLDESCYSIPIYPNGWAITKPCIE
ncbi:hypothetical protein [Leptospira levettii]|uniref:hypothetical protein n=1 Tax=Leptospira levettii TaxID=2023178 RepID=UPI000C29CEA5|nr:hypothetical protein [Leptospira levettii]PJZ89434.1 hypothetical protein CH368_06635 [Leptospira levettii]